MWKYVLKTALRQKLRFTFFVIMFLMSFLISSVSPYFNGAFIDMLSHPTNSQNVVGLSLFIAGLGIVGALLSYWANMITAKLITRTNMDLLKDEMKNLLTSELMFVEKQNPAYLMQRLSHDVGSIVNFVLSNFLAVILNLFLIAFILAFLAYTNWFLSVFTIFLCILYVFLFLLLKKPMYTSLSQKKETEARMYGFMTTQVGEVFSIQLNSQYKQSQNELGQVFRKSFPDILKAYKFSYLFTSADSIISVIFQAALFIYAGIQIIDRNMTIGEFITVNLYFTLLIKTIKYYVTFYKQYQNARASYMRLSEINTYPKIKTGGVKVEKINSISFNGTKFRFSNSDKELFHNLEYEFIKGQSYSLIGDNGSGKSTLLKIITNLYPSGDTVYFDNSLISELDMDDARKAHITCVPQVLYVPERDVLSYTCGLLGLSDEAARKKLIEAQYLKGFSEFILSALDKKCNTLSGGELRKLNIWIAVNRAKSVLILDEPTTGLDSRSKNDLIEYINRNPDNLLIIVMSHDEELLTATNRIIKLENGVFIDETQFSNDQ